MLPSQTIKIMLTHPPPKFELAGQETCQSSRTRALTTHPLSLNLRDRKPTVHNLTIPPPHHPILVFIWIVAVTLRRCLILTHAVCYAA